MSKGTSKIRNEKFEEINRLGEKLYQKLCEKEQKLRLLKKETSKYLQESEMNFK
jgi:prefoldin subunit 5